MQEKTKWVSTGLWDRDPISYPISLYVGDTEIVTQTKNILQNLSFPQV